MSKIYRVFVGLPVSLKNRVWWVERKYRHNSLSHIPGGSDVVVEYHDTRVFSYDWIKFPSAYVQKIWLTDISGLHRNFQKYNKDEQLKLIKDEIKRIFARKYKAEDFKIEPFKEVWNFETSDELPWERLKEFDQIGLDEFIYRQEMSPEYEKYLVENFEKNSEENALIEFLNRQEASPEYERYLIENSEKGIEE